LRTRHGREIRRRPSWIRDLAAGGTGLVVEIDQLLRRAIFKAIRDDRYATEAVQETEDWPLRLPAYATRFHASAMTRFTDLKGGRRR
jgi:hypothetical protein